MLARRQFLQFAATGATLALLPGTAWGAARGGVDRRFVFIIQRGAADGLNIIVPTRDPDYARLRQELAVTGGLPLDADFALHPALEETAKLYASKQALFVHAVASAYRDRSHFDGQNVLESGGTAPYQHADGWLNRMSLALPKAKGEAIAIAPTVPLALRGRAEVESYAPARLKEPGEDLLRRVGDLYAGDAQLGPLWAAALDARKIADGSDAKQLGAVAAKFLVAPSGPRIAMIETNGWDTHSGEDGRLKNQLTALDKLVAALRDGLGPAWDSTVVLVATEFGRTAALNGTGGTDHGTASAAMLLGGGVAGGRVLADWPGLSQGALYQGRDVKPTASLEDLIAGVATDGWGVGPAALFPGRQVKPRPGLLRA